MIRLDKLLADMQLGTRSELKKEIRKGAALVNRQVVKDPGFLLEGSEEIVFCGEQVLFEEAVYYMLNKPAGFLSATEDPKQKTVLDLITEPRRRDLFPVGRLDKDTEGLILLTNDGELAHRLLSPKRHVDKEYYVIVSGGITQEEIEAFKKGLKVSDDFTAMSADLTVIKESDGTEALITVREGKFHQIKRMFHAVGKEVLYLKRISMGPLVLDDSLAPGKYRRLTKEELSALKEV